MVDRLSRRHFIQRSAIIAAAAASANVLSNDPGQLSAAEESSNKKPFDLLITDGTVVDGSGKPRFKADVGVRNGRIIKVGKLGQASATKKIDGTGLIVAPGFIDMHTHSDRTLLADGSAMSAVLQGATTHVIGNCGSSPAPNRQPTSISGKTIHGYGDYLKALADSGVAINVCGLVGHNTIRTAVMGIVNRSPSKKEMAEMRRWIAEAMQGGAVGMSTGLVSPPGAFSETPELVELARVAGEMGGIYASHIRGEAGSLVESVREAIQIGRETKTPIQISHHKAAGKENWGSTRHTLAMIEEANQQGVLVRADVYPYRAGSAGLSQLVPPWAHEGGRSAMLARLKDPKTRQQIRRDMLEGVEGWPNFFRIDWNDIQISAVRTEKNKKWVGKKVADLARKRNCPGVDACIDLLIEEEGGARMINFIMDEQEVQRVLNHPLTMIGSDGTAVSPKTVQGNPHPRYYGCFPRVLGRYCRQLNLFSLERAIQKMTSMPATQLGLPDRGQIKAGAAADIVLFDFQKIIDTATFESPHQFPQGINAVIVNGQLVARDGKLTGERPGNILRPQRG